MNHLHPRWLGRQPYEELTKILLSSFKNLRAHVPTFWTPEGYQLKGIYKKKISKTHLNENSGKHDIDRILKSAWSKKKITYKEEFSRGRRVGKGRKASV